jgi:hydroxylaminobenzene mutase
VIQGPATLEAQGHRLIQVGLALFLGALIVGFAVPRFGVPRVGLSAHLLGVSQGVFLMVAGLLWTRVRLGRAASWIAFSLLIYGCFSAWIANLLAGVWRAGGTLLPFAAGAAQGSDVEEWIIAVGLRSAGVSLVLALVLLLWGTRNSGGS